MQNLAINFVLFFLLWQLFATFIAIVFVIYTDSISITDLISSQVITEVSEILFKYLSFSQIHVLGFQL